MKKKMLYVLSSLIIIFIIFQVYTSFAVGKTEQQKYEVLRKDGNIEVRYYPSCIMATVQKNGTYSKSANNGFRTLAGYIFGNNQENEKIAMTSPVWVKNEENNMQMSFVMPSKYFLKDLPSPNDENIQLKEIQPRRFVAIQFGGFSNDKKIKKKSEELIQWLEKEGITYEKEIYYAGYNPPYQLFNRLNEVLILLP